MGADILALCPRLTAQYTSAAFASLAGDREVTLSLGRTGQCWDNALSESFFASLKRELIDLQAWPTRATALRAIVEYIAHGINHRPRTGIRGQAISLTEH